MTALYPVLCKVYFVQGMAAQRGTPSIYVLQAMAAQHATSHPEEDRSVAQCVQSTAFCTGLRACAQQRSKSRCKCFSRVLCLTFWQGYSELHEVVWMLQSITWILGHALGGLHQPTRRMAVVKCRLAWGANHTRSVPQKNCRQIVPLGGA